MAVMSVLHKEVEKRHLGEHERDARDPEDDVVDAIDVRTERRRVRGQ